MVNAPLNYPIGTIGQPWGQAEKQTWLQTRKIHRSYQDHVVRPLRELANDDAHSFSKDFEIVQYGELDNKQGDGDCDSGDDAILPLLAVVPRTLTSGKPTVLVTGGTHGYETSGVLGALRFLSSGLANDYVPFLNVVVIPCVCPWGYERVERWVATAVDPNRSFGRVSSSAAPVSSLSCSDESLRTEESTKLIHFLDGLKSSSDSSGIDGGENDNLINPIQWLCHIDLHETTNSDFQEFRPAKAARDGLNSYDDHIPDGFYLVGDSLSNQSEWYNAIINAVENVTHIAEMESGGTLSGYPAESRGLIVVPCRELGLCAGGAVPGAKYVATTEVYPDSERTTSEDCIKAQVEAVCAAFDYLLEKEVEVSC